MRRPISTTEELVHVIKAAIPSAARRDGPHPAKRTFQAIRIEVNNELPLSLITLFPLHEAQRFVLLDSP